MMAKNSCPPSKGPFVGQGPTTAGGSAPFGSMYLAFDDYERQARQRKYMIAEYEDTIENLKKELKEVSEKNKAKEAECEKLEIVARVAEAHYEKKVKEKELMESAYRNIAKEMAEVVAEITRKKERLSSLKLFHQEKLNQAKKMEEKHMAEYMKIPRFAEILENTKEREELEVVLKEKTLELERRKKDQQVLKNKHNNEWDVFKKKCIRLAEIRRELFEKSQLLDKLRADYAMKLRAPSGVPVRRVPSTPSASTQQSTRHNFSPRFNGTSRLELSSTFRQLDRMCQSSAVVGRRTSIMSPVANGSWRELCSPSRSGPTLISKLKSKLKGTVTVHPMPRNPEIQEDCRSVGNESTEPVQPSQSTADLEEVVIPPPPSVDQSTFADPKSVEVDDKEKSIDVEPVVCPNGKSNETESHVPVPSISTAACKGPELNFLGGFGGPTCPTSPVAAESGGMDFFGNFFASSTSTPKTPQFNFMF